MKIIKTIVMLILLTVSFTANAVQTSFLDQMFESEQSIEMRAAHKWVMQSKCKISSSEADRLVKTVYKTSNNKKINPRLVLGLIKHESCFNNKAVSKSGAIGYTQVLPNWHQDKIKGRDLNKTSVNIDVGTSILKEYLKSSRGNIRKALTKYSGNSNSYYNKVLHNLISLENNIVSYRTALRFKNINVLLTDLKYYIQSATYVIFNTSQHLLIKTNLILTKDFSVSKSILSPYQRYKNRTTKLSLVYQNKAMLNIFSS